jgi:hypothetical protein
VVRSSISDRNSGADFYVTPRSATCIELNKPTKFGCENMLSKSYIFRVGDDGRGIVGNSPDLYDVQAASLAYYCAS